MNITRDFIPTRCGRIHVACCGSGFPILLLHQTPRSWNEFRAVLPLLGQRYRAIAMDTVGFGDSEPVPENSIERWAAAAIALLDAMAITSAVVVGHHTGAVIALEMAASQRQRVAALALSSMSLVDAERRAEHAGKRPIDEVEPRADGSHLSELWQRRQPFYPPGDFALLDSFMIDALKAGALAAEGHRVVNRYRMEERLPLIACPTLVIGADADPHAYPSAARVAAAIPCSVMTVIRGGGVPLPEQMPQSFAEVLMTFLTDIHLG